MATAYTSIQITDGTTTVDITDSTNYTLNGGGWSPGVAKLRAAGVGGQSPYEDVLETITFSIFAASITTALSKASTIENLFAQARAFAMGEQVSPVELQVEPQGTTSNEWRALIVDGELILPQDWADNLANKAIENCVLRIVRRGIWLKTSYSPSSVACTAGVTSGVISTGATLNKYSPFSIVMRDQPNLSGVIKSGMIAVSNATNKLVVVDSTSATLSGTTSTQAKTYALGGNVARLQSTGKATFTFSSFNSSARRMAIFASVKHTTAATDPPEFDISVGSSFLSSHVQTNRVKPSLNLVTFCGIFERNTLIDQIIIARASTDIDVDYIAIVQADDPNTFVIDFETPNATLFTVIPTNNNGFGVLNDPLAVAAPYAYVRDNTDNRFSIGVLGDKWLTTTGSVYVLHMAQGQGNEWRPNIASGSVQNTSAYVVAREGQVVLQ